MLGHQAALQYYIRITALHALQYILQIKPIRGQVDGASATKMVGSDLIPVGSNQNLEKNWYLSLFSA